MLRTEPVSAPRHMAWRDSACMQRHMACKIKAAGHNTHTATPELRFISSQHTAVLFVLAALFCSGLSAASVDAVMDWEYASSTRTGSAHSSQDTIDSQVTASSDSSNRGAPVYDNAWEGGFRDFPLGRSRNSWSFAPPPFIAIATHYHHAASELRAHTQPHTRRGLLPEIVDGSVLAEYRRRFAAVNPHLGPVDPEACYAPPGRWTSPEDRATWANLCPPQFQPRSFFSVAVQQLTSDPTLAYEAGGFVLQLREGEEDEDEAELLFGGSPRHAQEYPPAPRG